MKRNFFNKAIFSAVLTMFFVLTVSFASENEDKRISPWNAKNVHTNIIGQWKLEGYYEGNKLVTDYKDKNLIWSFTEKEIHFDSDELGKGTTVYDLRRTIYRISPTMLILTDPDINLYHGKFIVENMNSTKLELVDWNDKVRFNLTRVVANPIKE